MSRYQLRQQIRTALGALLFILFVTLATTCSEARADGLRLSLGLAAHAVVWDAPEVHGLDNPLGYVELAYCRGPWCAYLLHVSSVPVWERGYGFNTAGVRYSFNLWGGR